MKRVLRIILAIVFAVGVAQLSYAAEHGGKEHGGTTGDVATPAAAQPSTGDVATPAAAQPPSNEDIRQAMADYVAEESAETGTFGVYDPEIGAIRQLSLVRVHERVGKTGDYYYSCADFKDTNTGDMLDLDLDVEEQEGELTVVDVRIHKLNDVARYTYDDHDNRIPVASQKTEESPEAASPTGHEHGGKEHGGM